MNEVYISREPFNFNKEAVASNLMIIGFKPADEEYLDSFIQRELEGSRLIRETTERVADTEAQKMELLIDKEELQEERTVVIYRFKLEGKSLVVRYECIPQGFEEDLTLMENMIKSLRLDD